MARSDLISPTTWGAVRGSINSMLTELYAAIASYGTKGTANGVASLDGSAHVPVAQISLASTNLTDSASLERVVGTFASSAALQTAFPAASNTGNKALVGASAPYTNYSSNGSAWVKGVSASTDLSDGVALNAAVTNSVKYAANWNAATNVVTGVTGLTALANSNPGAQTAFVNTAAGTTTVAYLGSITSVNFNDEVLWNPITSTWTLCPYNAPSVLGIFATTGAITYPAASWNGYSVSIGSSAPYQTYTSNGSAWVMDDAATINASIASNTSNITANTAALSVQTDNAQTGTTYTLVLADAGQNVDMNNASANTLTIPPNSSVAFPIGTLITVTMAGAGITTIAAGAGVTVVKPSARTLAISAQYETAQLYKTATDTWRVLAG